MLFGFGVTAEWIDGLTSVVLLAAIYSHCRERRQRAAALMLGLPPVVLSLCGHLLTGAVGRSVLFLGHCCAVAFLFGSAVVIVRALFTKHRVTLDSMLGALCGYLFLGLAFGMMFSMIEVSQPGSFRVPDELQNDANQPESFVLIYYSFVTLTTVGYGDVTPLTVTTRTLAWVEAILGQFYLAIIVAGVVSMLVANSSGGGAAADGRAEGEREA